MQQVEKVLSPNDTGETGTHQAGWLVPKNPAILGFFPKLDPTVRNPRCVIDLTDEAGDEWALNYIYYNNRLFGGTRNEYRLTGVTGFVRQYQLRSGDQVVISREGNRRFRIRIRRKDGGVETRPDGTKVLRLSGSWTVVTGG